MNEIIAIVSQLIIFLLIFSFPLNPSLLNKILLPKNYHFGTFDTLLINGVFILNFLLLCSFLNLELKNIFYTLIFISIFINIFNFNKWKKYLVKEKINIYFFLVICLCIFFGLANNLKFEWDGIAHWFFKTKSFYDGHDVSNIKNLPASNYPYLGTYLWAFFWKNAVIEYEYLGRLIYIFIFILSIFSISCSIIKKKDFDILFVFPIVLVITVLTYDEYLFGGYQEYLLFSFMALMSKLILNIISNNSSSIKQLLILIFTGNLLIYFKDEGIVYLILIFFIFQFFLKKNLHRSIVAISSIIIITIQFILEKNIIQAVGFQENLMDININYILNFNFIITNSILIIKYLIISILKYPIWIITFVSIYTIMKNKLDQKLIYFLLLMILGIFGFYYLLYMIHPQTSEFLMKVTLDRLVFQTSGFFMIYIIIAYDIIVSNLDKSQKK